MVDLYMVDMEDMDMVDMDMGLLDTREHQGTRTALKTSSDATIMINSHILLCLVKNKV